MESAFDALAAAGIPVFEASFTALDAYHGLKGAPISFAVAESSLVELAKASEGIEYPGLSYADAALVNSEGEARPPLYIRLADSKAEAEGQAFAPLDMLRDPKRGVYLDPKGVYSSLRERLLEPRRAPDEDLVFQAAGLLARYDYELPELFAPALPQDFSVSSQRDLLALVLTGRAPSGPSTSSRASASSTPTGPR